MTPNGKWFKDFELDSINPNYGEFSYDTDSEEEQKAAGPYAYPLGDLVVYYRDGKWTKEVYEQRIGKVLNDFGEVSMENVDTIGVCYYNVSAY